MEKHLLRELVYEEGTIIVGGGVLNEHVGSTNGSFYEGSETQHKYGRLFAAAPDLYKVVEELCSCKRAGVGKALQEAGLAALAKAKGTP